MRIYFKYLLAPITDAFESWRLLVNSPKNDLTYYEDFFEELSFFHIHEYDFLDVYSTIDVVSEILNNYEKSI